MSETISPLQKLREPFPEHQISKLPKPTKKQTEEVRDDFKKGKRCTICGAWHHPEVVHLDYVGHAALTDRLLDTDIAWQWEPFALTSDGLPALDATRGMWIRLTVCGVTRIGYGAADGKTGGDAMKEIIGDALRNAAMRFGAALDLWHKGDLHVDDTPTEPTTEHAFPNGPATNITGLKTLCRGLWREIEGCGDESELGPLLIVPSNKAIMDQLEALENPEHRKQLWEGDGKDNPGISGLIARKRKLFEMEG